MGTETVATVRDAMLERVSWPKVTDDAPTHDELADLVTAASRVADHAGLTPWRLIELRAEDDRVSGRGVYRGPRPRRFCRKTAARAAAHRDRVQHESAPLLSRSGSRRPSPPASGTR